MLMWARGALDDGMDLDEMRDCMLREFAAALGRKLSDLPPLLASEAVIWPYGNKDYEVEGGCVWLEDMELAFAGDYCYNGRVEGAWLSGRAAAARTLASFTSGPAV